MRGQTTSHICNNCGQPVLQGDVACWHCGVQLKLFDAAPDFEPEESWDENAGEKVPPRRILFYAIMTVVTGFALLLVTRSLGRQPRLVASFEASGTVAVELSAADGSFSIEVPQESIWYFPPARRGRGEDAVLLTEDPRFESALQPLAGLVPDSQALLLVQMDSAFLAVAHSKRLGELKINNVVSSLVGEEFPGTTVLSAEESSSRAGQALAAVTIVQDDPPLICRQNFLPYSKGAYLASICTEPEKYPDRAAVFDTVLQSFTVHRTR